LLVAIFALILVVHWALALAGEGVLALGIVAAVAGGAAVFAIGLTYRVKPQPGWRHWSTLVSLFGGVLAVGIAAALVVALAWPDSLPGDTRGILAARTLVIVGAAALALASVGRSIHLGRGGPSTEESWVLTKTGYRWEHVASVLLLVVTALAAALASAWAWAIIVAFAAALAAGYARWRMFFATAVPLSWKSEVRWSLPRGIAGKEG
jgi:hypothetical protein